ncbi:RHS repeat-associated core domain-containing protein, partial [Chitinophagaceae bacterium LWZ2-11]
PLTEETAYYPFGLTMAGISSKALTFGDPKNKEKTFQGQRFDDDLDLNWVQFKWRNHDPQIGRFIEIDPLAEDYEYNSIYAFSENKVTNHVELEGLESVSADLLRQAQEAPPQAKVAFWIVAGAFFLGEIIYDEIKNPTVTTPAVPGGLGLPGWDPIRRTYTPSGSQQTSVKSTSTDDESKKPASNPQKEVTPAQARADKLSQKQRPGKNMTKAGKEAVIDVNKEKNKGKSVCENCGVETQPAEQSKKGVTPPKNETQVDHKKRKRDGGSGTPDNGQVLCRGCNAEKH